MERIVYDRMAELDSRHWWYRARREVLAELIRRKIALPDQARILEIGCARLGCGRKRGASPSDQHALETASELEKGRW